MAVRGFFSRVRNLRRRPTWNNMLAWSRKQHRLLGSRFKVPIPLLGLKDAVYSVVMLGWEECCTVGCVLRHRPVGFFRSCYTHLLVIVSQGSGVSAVFHASSTPMLHMKNNQVIDHCSCPTCLSEMVPAACALGCPVLRGKLSRSRFPTHRVARTLGVSPNENDEIPVEMLETKQTK